MDEHESTVADRLQAARRSGFAEVGIDTLESRLRQEVVAAGAVGVAPLFVGAWASEPEGRNVR